MNCFDAPDTTERALMYAECYGWAVLPCTPGGKAPMIAKGFYGATTCAFTLERWFEDWPSANIALRTGTESDLVVIDVDLYKKDCRFKELEQRYGPLPKTRTVQTPSGGLHLYYRMPPKQIIRCSQNFLATSVDVLGEGGYIMAPSSVIDSKPYRVIHDRNPRTLPAWTCELLAVPRPSSVAAAPKKSLLTTCVGFCGIDRAVERCLPTGKRQNNDRIFDLARLLKGGCDADEGVGAFDAWFAKASALGFTRYDYQHYRDKFDRAWMRVKFPVSTVILEVALQKVQSEPLPVEAMRFKKPKKALLLAWCRELELTGGEWFLSCRDAGRLLGIDFSTAALWLRDFLDLGLLKITQDPTRELATCYRYLGML
jgi:hypothetical protein